MLRRMRAARGAESGVRLSRRGRGLVEARGGCLERSGTLGHQVFAPLGKEAHHACVKDIPTSSHVLSYDFLVTPHAVLYGGTQAENKPTNLTGDRKFASDPCITGALEA
jgi:hypothetical protein